MKKILFALLAVASVAIAVPRSASAQDPALVRVPFQFIVNGTLLPAGSYRITSDTQDPSLLVITNLKGKPAASFATVGWEANPQPMDPQVHVAFKNFDGQYFLWRVAMPGSDSREVVINKVQAERMLAKLNIPLAEPATPTK